MTTTSDQRDAATEDEALPRSTAPQRPQPTRWLLSGLGVIGLAVVAWVCLTQWGAVRHGHPAYAVMLLVTAAGSVLLLWGAFAARPTPRRHGWRRVFRIAVIVAAVAWLVLVAWLRPFSATQPALGAMTSGAEVRVSETATEIVFSPTGAVRLTGLFFQPGARVDPRAYAADMRPLAAAGFTVVVAKQPLGIAFTAMGAFDRARTEHPEVTQWVVGGHSLGGTAACMEAAQAHDDAADRSAGDRSAGAAPVVGLLLYASYPASKFGYDLPALSIWGSNDGLATPDKMNQNSALMPPSTEYLVILGGNHAQFGSYGPQPGDNPADITAEAQRAEVVAASLRFLTTLDATI